MLGLLIRNYRNGMAAYNSARGLANDECDAYAAQTYVPPLEALRAFDGAATSLKEAHDALDLAEQELRDGDIETAEILIRSARLYLVEVNAHG